MKARQAELALRFREFFKGEFILPRGHVVNDHSQKIDRIMSQRQTCYEEMAILNKRGI